jgi:hypothetical protein
LEQRANALSLINRCYNETSNSLPNQNTQQGGRPKHKTGTDYHPKERPFSQIHIMLALYIAQLYQYGVKLAQVDDERSTGWLLSG